MHKMSFGRGLKVVVLGFTIVAALASCKPRQFNDNGAEVLGGDGKYGGKSHVMIVDGETDDLGAISTTLAEAKQHGDKLALIISAGPDVYVTDLMVKKYLKAQGITGVQTAVGTGLSREEYAKMGSTSTALAYQEKGHGVLTEAELKAFVGKTSDGKQGQEAFRKVLAQSGQKGVVLQIAAEATDAAAVLYEEPTDSEAINKQKREYQKRIDANLMMGGVLPEPGPAKVGEQTFTEGIVQEASYNFDMNPVAANKMLSIKGIQTLVHSSNAIQPAFAGGLNDGNAHDFIDALYGDHNDPQEAEFVKIMREVNGHWDANAQRNLQALYDRLKGAFDADPERDHKIETYKKQLAEFNKNKDAYLAANGNKAPANPEPQPHPALQSLKLYGGQQLTPADLLLVAQYYDKTIAKKTRLVTMSVSGTEIGPRKSGFVVKIKPSDRSNVTVITEVNTFQFKKSAAAAIRYAKKNFRAGKAGSLEELSNESASKKFIEIGSSQKDLLRVLSQKFDGQKVNDIGRFMDNYKLNERQVEEVVKKIEMNKEFSDAHSNKSTRTMDILKDIIRVEAPKAKALKL